LATSAQGQIAHDRRIWRIAYVSMLILGAVLALLARRGGPGGFPVATAVLLTILFTWVMFPTVALHLTVFATLVGDSVTMIWYPMVKNFSSHESILFIDDRLTFSPMDLILIVAAVALLLRSFASDEPIIRGPLLRPLVVFTGFVVLGFVHGLAGGGDRRVAVFEVRPLLYLPVVYLLASNLCRTAVQFRRLMWTALAAILVQSLVSLLHFAGLSSETKSNLESLGEHGAAVGMNLLFLLLIAWWAFRGCSLRGRAVLIGMTIPVFWAYLLYNRRAGVVGLLGGVVLLSVILFWRQPRTFWRFTPVVAIVLLGYLAAFWNSTSLAGFPAQAVKAVISPNSVSAKDASSDIYRLLEIKNLNYTVRQSKLLGLGFGRPFLQPFPMPNISQGFEFHNYIAHNSILWIWIQTGFFGFVAMFYVFGRSLMLGAARTRALPDGPDVAVVGTATIAIAVFAIFAYVDIAWDARNTLLLGLVFAIAAHYPVPKETAMQPNGLPEGQGQSTNWANRLA
jgi:hypothetical protein